MTRQRALRLAREWAQGHKCTLRDGEAAEYHSMLAAMLKEAPPNEQEEFEQTYKRLDEAIADLLEREEAAEARCTRLEEARERANEACAKWEARAEQAEKERDAAISDLETAMAYGIESNCLLCKNDQCYVRGGGKPCLPKWRGTKEE